MELNSGGETAVGSGVENLFVLHDCISPSEVKPFSHRNVLKVNFFNNKMMLDRMN